MVLFLQESANLHATSANLSAPRMGRRPPVGAAVRWWIVARTRVTGRHLGLPSPNVPRLLADPQLVDQHAELGVVLVVADAV
jgi:hypothetical protein